MLVKRIVVFLIIGVCFQFVEAATGVDSLLQQLSGELTKKNVYDKVKQQQITELKNKIAQSVNLLDEYTYTKKLIEAYVPYRLDSTLYYIQQNKKNATALNNLQLQNEVNVMLAGVLSSSGSYKEAVDLLNAVNKNTLTQSNLVLYYYNYMWVYYRLMYYTPFSEFKKSYSISYSAYADSLLQVSAQGSEVYLSAKESLFRENGALAKSNKLNRMRMQMGGMGTRAYSRAAFFTSQNFLLEGDSLGYKKYLALAALSDIKGAVKDNAALTNLAIALFKEGNIPLAHQFINAAFDDASFYNSKLRYVSISNIMPLINKAYEADIKIKQEKLQRNLLVISGLLLCLLVVVVFSYTQNRKLKHAREQLQHTNQNLVKLNEELEGANKQLSNLYAELTEVSQVKEYYIGNLLNLCSDYLDKLDVFSKRVHMMLLSHQSSKLVEMTKSDKYLKEEIQEFHKNFDTIFLNIYPNFVSSFNLLLREEERIALKKGELLTTELRIFALIRLGISDSSKIARLLRYSVNTIYNYRVKIKNKAIDDREEFENEIMKIGV